MTDPPTQRQEEFFAPTSQTADDLLRYILSHLETETAGWCQHLADCIRTHLSK